MKTIKMVATVRPDGTLTAQVPPEVPPGEHRVVLVVEEPPGTATAPPLEFPVDDWGPWPAGLSLRREDLYDDWGR